MMLSKTTRDAVKWALERLGEKQEVAKVASASNSYPQEFEWIWSAKPDREGSNPKKQAYQACCARIKEGSDWRELAEGVKRYRRYCDAKRLTGTEKVQQMATFFGTKLGFKEGWTYEASKQSTNAGGMSAAQAAIAAARQQRDGATSGSPLGFNDRVVHGQVDQEEWSGRIIDMDGGDF